MRGIQALAAYAYLTAVELEPAKTPRPLPRAQREGDSTLLNRAAMAPTRAAIVASLWTRTRQCLVAPRYRMTAGEAELGKVRYAEDAQALQRRLAGLFGEAAPITAADQPLRRAA